MLYIVSVLYNIENWIQLNIIQFSAKSHDTIQFLIKQSQFRKKINTVEVEI